ncbi:glycosyltransferase family 2 protein [Neorhizobium sp. NCHU2750]|uniref:glycosyltransferase family 2 protein n=1 Tax=Neorhizobium sp. NCHU2750 TaxID=1825976 RepID=UPI000EB7013E|nr:glycosyltransferase [Neorhizobium sp. NCHU2750]
MTEGGAAYRDGMAPLDEIDEASRPRQIGSVPKIAVIITCWNYEDYVARAIGSVIGQGRADCELVVIDDGSTDRSWEVIAATGVKACSIRNGGQRLACLEGLKRTTAPFVLFLDADDELMPGSLDKIAAHLDEDVAKLQFPLIRIDAAGDVISGPVPPLSDFRGRELADNVLKTGAYMSPPTSGNVFRRDVAGLIEGAGYERAVDGVILFAAPFWGDIVSLSEPLGRYRVHGRNDSGFSSQLNPRPLQQEVTRFADRLEHLRSLLADKGMGSRLVTTDHAYFFQERSFYLAIAEGKPFAMRRFLHLLSLLWRDPQGVNFKLSMTVFFLIAFLLPNVSARRVVNYRLQAGKRSFSGLIKAIF